VSGDYYDQPLEFRRDCLQAASVDHLCKSIIMENTKAHSSVQGWDNPNNSKYYVVIVQVGGSVSFSHAALAVGLRSLCCSTAMVWNI
jgi:hypothetical protein